MTISDPIAAAVDYWRTQADGRARTISTLIAQRDEARRDADMWHDEAHRLGLEVERLRALAVGATAPTPSSLT